MRFYDGHDKQVSWHIVIKLPVLSVPKCLSVHIISGAFLLCYEVGMPKFVY